MKPYHAMLCCLVMLFTGIAYAQRPVEFVQNKGQWGDWFSYKAETSGGDVMLEKDGFRFILADRRNSPSLDSFHHGLRKDNPTLRFHVYKVTFEGSAATSLQGLKPQKTYYNYYLGNDSSKWKTGIHPDYAVDYNNLYSNIDLHVSSEKGQVVYELMIKPGADDKHVKIKFDGQDGIHLRKGDLLINTSVGDVKEVKPYAYQYINDVKTEVACNYVLKNNEVTFEFPNDYDHAQLLIIDPTIVFSTFTGSTADNWGFTATYDDSGNFYAGGLVNCLTSVGGGSFPVSPGAFQTTWGGGYGSGGLFDGYAYGADISIIKYNATGNTRLFATYLGGSGNEHVHSMIVDHSGNLVLAGRTLSGNFPVTSGAYQGSNHGGWDMIVTSLNSTGTALIGSTYIGGTNDDCVNFDSTEFTYGELKHNYGDESRSEVQVDNSNNIYVAGCTYSTDFPTTSTASSTTLSGMQDGLVFKMNSSCSSLIWSTYLGGNGSDASYVLGFDSLQQYLYVGGGTNSSNFPTTSGAWQTTYQGGGADGFITKFLNSGTYAIQKSSYVGTTGYDQVYGVQLYPTNEVYLMGQSIGGLFPVTAGVYSNPNSSQFIMKMDRNLATDLISTVYGSGLSTATNISPVAFLVDTCSNVYVSGWGGSLGIPGETGGTCSGMPTTTGASTDGNDFYFIVLGENMTVLRYATFYGRTCTFAGYGEHVDGGTSRFDKNGIIYQAICANCGGSSGISSGSCTDPFPTTAGAWATVDASSNCNEAALKIAFEIGPVTAHITAGPSTSGCAPLTVVFNNMSSNGLGFVWNFGDGSPVDTSFSPTHTYTTGGVFTVMLTATNTNACFRTDDTAYLTIVTDTNTLIPAFTSIVTDSCGPYIASFINTSHTGTSSSPLPTSSFSWSFGDGSSFSGVTPPPHTYPSAGTYTVTLIESDPTACNSPDTIQQVIKLQGFRVSGNFTIPDSLCVGMPFVPTTNIQNATSATWTFGNGDSSTSIDPTYHFDSAGTYTITMIVDNADACNGADTFIEHITVISAPIANFSITPITPEPNIPTSFTNLSINATRYQWDFGDATTSTDINPVHQFSKTGTYKVCLTAYNSSDCPSRACRQVESDVVPTIGLPQGFSPNGDGENDILYVRGAAIAKMDLKIFNRWGQLVFETTSQAVGWDGSFNGQPQPIDAYAYVLDVSFIDGTTKLLKGNITLLR